MTDAKLCLGGSFDPVHCGHIGTAKALSTYFSVDVGLVPNNLPVHRLALSASQEQRLAMLSLACENEPSLYVDTIELQRDGPTFTIDTLTIYRQQVGDQVPIIWCLGMDAFAQLSTWKDWPDLLNYGHLLVLQRPQSPLPKSQALTSWWRQHQVSQAKHLLHSAHGHIAQIGLPQFDISATHIRRLLHNRQQPDSHLLPIKVANYILEHDIYNNL